MNNTTENLNASIKNRHWYHQRFDGAPLCMSLIAEAETVFDERRPPGTEAVCRVCFFENGKADWFLDQADIDRGARIVTKLADGNDLVSQKLMECWSKDEEQFVSYFRKFNHENLKNLSDKQLAKEFHEFHNLAVKRFTSSAIIDHFALGTDQVIADMIRHECGILENESEFTQIFSALTAPVHQSFINEAEISILAIAARIQSGEKLTDAAIQKSLAEHQQKYFWIQNNYVRGDVLTSSDFEQEVTAWLATGKPLALELKKIKLTPIASQRIKKGVLDQHNFSPLLKNLLQISENFTKWQDDRKQATYWSAYLGQCIIQEMTKRRLIPAELGKYLLATEVEKWFLEDSISQTELEERKKQSVVIWRNDQSEVFSGQIVDEIRQTVLGDIDHSKKRDVRGLVACTGIAEGRVKVVMSATEIGKVSAGDILVAVMTRPDYIPAMKKAAAIVTDEGGVTCHAAIVSRELGIPCIIGTKIATKIFKDGDDVLVNANHGIVSLRGSRVLE